MIRCHHYRDEVELLRDGVVAAERASLLLAHRDGCADCRAFDAATSALTAVLAGFPDGPYLPPDTPPGDGPGAASGPRRWGGPGPGFLALLLGLVAAGGTAALLLRPAAPGRAAGTDTARATPSPAGTGSREDHPAPPADTVPASSGPRSGDASADGETAVQSQLEGRVVAWPGGRGLAGVRLLFEGREVVTGPSGAWTFEAPSDHVSRVLTVTPPGGTAEAWLLPAVDPGSPTRVSDLVAGPPATVRARVLGPDGRPAAGALVAVHLRLHGSLGEWMETFHIAAGDGPPPFRAVRTDSRGEVVLDGLSPTSVVLCATLEGFAPSEAVAVLPWPGPVPLEPDVVLGLEAAAELRGEVVDAEGRPVAGAVVRASRSREKVNRRDPLCTFETRTGQDGRFLLRPVPPGRLEVRVAPGPHRPDVAAVASDTAFPRPLRLRLPLLAEARERFLDTTTGRPAAGAAFLVGAGVGPGSGLLHGGMVVPADGVLRIPDFPVGLPVGYLTTPTSSWDFDPEDPGFRFPVPVKGDGPVPVRLLRPTTVLEVSVMDDHGRPVPGAAVVGRQRVYRFGMEQRPLKVVQRLTDEHGRARLPGFAPGRAEVVALPPDLAGPVRLDRFRGSALLDGRTPDVAGLLCEIPAGAGTVPLRRTASRAVPVTGVAAEADGSPLLARLGRPGGAPEAGLATDGDGRFTMAVAGDAAPEELPFLLRDGTRGVLRPAGGGRWTPDPGSLRPPLRGTVLDAGGRPVPGASVRLGQSPPPTEAVELGPFRPAEALLPVAADGSFRWSGSSPRALRGTGLHGPYLVACAPGHLDATLDAGSIEDGAASLVLEPARTLRLRLVDAAGRPLPRTGLLPVGLPTLPGIEGTFAAMTDGEGRVDLHPGPLLPPWLLVEDTTDPEAPFHELPFPPFPSGEEDAVVTVVVPPWHTLEGRLLDPRSRPVAGMQVILSGPEPHLVMRWSTVSRPDGTFRLEHLPAGPARLLVRTPPEGTHPWRRLGRDLDLPVDGPLDLHLEEGATLRGRLVRGDGGPLPRTFVYVGDPVAAGARSDGEGRFTLRGLPPPPWTLRARPDGAEVTLEVAGASGEELLFPVGPAPVGTRSLRVTVRSRGPGEPGELGATLRQGEGRVERGLRVRHDGTVETTFPPGEGWALELKRKDGRTGWVDLPARGEVDGEFDLDALADPGLQGRVLLPGGAPAAGVPVEARRVDPATGPSEGAEFTWFDATPPDYDGTPVDVRRTVTDAEGRFHLGSPPGLWRVAAGRLGDAVVPDGWAQSPHPHAAPVAPPVLPSEPLDLRLLDDGGRPRPHVELRIEPQSPPGSPPSPWVATVRTDGDGRARHPGLPPGTLRLTEVDPGGSPRRWEVAADGRRGDLEAR